VGFANLIMYFRGPDLCGGCASSVPPIIGFRAVMKMLAEYAPASDRRRDRRSSRKSFPPCATCGFQRALRKLRDAGSGFSRSLQSARGSNRDKLEHGGHCRFSSSGASAPTDVQASQCRRARPMPIEREAAIEPAPLCSSLAALIRVTARRSRRRPSAQIVGGRPDGKADQIYREKQATGLGQPVIERRSRYSPVAEPELAARRPSVVVIGDDVGVGVGLGQDPGSSRSRCR